MRKNSREFVDILLLHYETTYALWSSISNLYGLKWVMPQRVVGSLRMLEWAARFFSNGSSVEDDPILLDMVYLERKK
jgi:hypothetical protein